MYRRNTCTRPTIRCTLQTSSLVYCCLLTGSIQYPKLMQKTAPPLNRRCPTFHWKIVLQMSWQRQEGPTRSWTSSRYIWPAISSVVSPSTALQFHSACKRVHNQVSTMTKVPYHVRPPRQIYLLLQKPQIPPGLVVFHSITICSSGVCSTVIKSLVHHGRRFGIFSCPQRFEDCSAF